MWKFGFLSITTQYSNLNITFKLKHLIYYVQLFLDVILIKSSKFMCLFINSFFIFGINLKSLLKRIIVSL